MRAYHKINPAVWRDEKVRAFSDDGQLAWIYMLTHPTLNALGVLPATIEGLAAERRWTSVRFRKAIAPAVAQDMLELDESAGYIGFRHWLKYNEPEGPNAVNGAWLKSLDEIPECPAKLRLVTRCRAYLEQKAPTWKDREKSIKAEVWDAFTVEPSRDTSGEPSTYPSQEGSGDGPCTRARTSASASATATTRPPHSPPRGARSLDPPGFTRFWGAYPKKVGPDAALKKWKEKGCERIADEVIAGLEANRAYLMREDGRFILNPTSWLNQGHWKDQPPTNGHDPRHVNAAWDREATAEAGS